MRPTWPRNLKKEIEMTINIPDKEKPPLPPGARSGPPPQAPKIAPASTGPKPGPRIPEPFPPSSSAPRPQRVPNPPRVPEPTPRIIPSVATAEAGEAEVTSVEVAGEVAGVGAAEVAGVAVPVVGALVAIGATVAGVVLAIKDDNNKREAYTKQFVAQTSNHFPNCNIVICHPQHTVTGPHIVHQHHELPMT